MPEESAEPVDELPSRQLDEIEMRDLAEKLKELSAQLRAAGERIEGRFMYDSNVTYMNNHWEEMSPEEVDDANARTRSEFRGMLRALRSFRREYDRWERLTAEYALEHMNYSQREAAQELGVAASTINRWAQHPLKIEDYRNAE